MGRIVSAVSGKMSFLCIFSHLEEKKNAERLSCSAAALYLFRFLNGSCFSANHLRK
jgi:hypothetical protein